MTAETDPAAAGLALSELARDRVWRQPLRFRAADDGDRAQLVTLVSSGGITGVVDPIEEYVDELYELRRVGDRADHEARDTFRSRFLAEADRYGVWFFFPWSGDLVRYPEEQEHRRLRTFRNREVITLAEQDLLADAKIAVFGLSVGSNVVDQFIQVGIGGSYLIGDMDRVSPSNLNRMRATMSHVGMAKTDVLARKISEVDPYIDQIHLPDGYGTLAEEQLTAFGPDLIVEEVDDLTIKARIRQWASGARTPLIMVSDVGERSIVDVERHDLGSVRPFNGRLKRATFDRLADGTLTPAEERRLLVKVVGPRNLSVRMLQSALRLDKELAGMPQIGSAASAGAAVASVAARALLGREPLKSGAYVLSPRRLLGLGRQAGIRDTIEAVRSLRRHLDEP